MRSHASITREESSEASIVYKRQFIGKVYVFYLIGPMKKYRNIEARQVAKELFNAVDGYKITSNYLIEVYEN